MEYPQPEPQRRRSPVAKDLHGAIMRQCKENSGLSGFMLLKTGSDAFAARMALIQASKDRLDLQYYIVQDDLTGKLLIEELFRAADRGVKVRLLLDDLDFWRSRDTVLTLHTHENIEIRIFNPMVKRWLRTLLSVPRWAKVIERYSKRMHNKALLADGVLSVTGGRNLGDEYFDARAAFAFNDLDVLVAGPLVAGMEDAFDAYWNAPAAYTLERLEVEMPGPRQTALYRLALCRYYDDVAHRRVICRRKPAEMIEELCAGKLQLVWTEAELVTDNPNKVLTPVEQAESPPMERLEALLDSARTEFIAVSPYFIPAKRGKKMLQWAIRRGVKVRLLTNSLASTDISAVHAVYSRYRAGLLRRGIRLYELRPIPGKRTRHNLFRKGSSRSSLHAKVYVIDRQWVMVGSMNLDPRSWLRNTETMIVIHSPGIAQEIAEMFDAITAPATSYRLKLVDKGKQWIEWFSEEKGIERRYKSDPEPGWFRRLSCKLFYYIAPEGQL